jgi:hypothetical protein
MDPFPRHVKHLLMIRDIDGAILSDLTRFAPITRAITAPAAAGKMYRNSYSSPCLVYL